MAYTDRFDDVFTEASDVDLTAHTPTGAGTSWVLVGRTSGGVAKVDSATNTVDHPFAGGGTERDGSAATFSGAWADDQQAEATGFGNGQSTTLAIGTRIQDDGAGLADGYFVYHNGGSNQWVIGRVDSGGTTELGTFGDASEINTDVIICQSEGTTHKMFENGTERISVSDSTYSSGGSPGLMTIRSYDGQGLDDFVGRDQAAVGGANPKGPLGMPLHGPFGGPISV